jgi:hypothetical protein
MASHHHELRVRDQEEIKMVKLGLALLLAREVKIPMHLEMKAIEVYKKAKDLIKK